MEDNSALVGLIQVGGLGLIFGYLIICIIVASLTQAIAKSKNLRWRWWANGSLLVCVFLSPLAGLVVMLACGLMEKQEKRPAKAKPEPFRHFVVKED